MTDHIIYPAYLCVTPDPIAEEQLHLFLQTFLCTNKQCGQCQNCIKIKEHQHPSALWVTPKNKYLLDDLDDVFNAISFELEENEHYFFIFKDAHLLSPACTNALLKIVEEPPKGFHFIFATNSVHHLLVTLRSRCIIQHLGGSYKKTSLYADYFIQKTNPQTFATMLQTSTVSEAEIIELVDYLIEYYINKKVQLDPLDLKNRTVIDGILLFLQKTFSQPLMPGGAKIFLRDLYLHKDMLERKNVIS